ASQPEMHCHRTLVDALSLGFVLAGFAHLLHHRKTQLSYGRHMRPTPLLRTVPAPLAWFLQEMPAFLIPLLLTLTPHQASGTGKRLLLGTFVTHYFQRTFIYSFLTRGRPFPLNVMVAGAFFCSLSGFLQGHYLLHCAQYDQHWTAGFRCRTGLLLFYTGMAINIHSDSVLRNLREPGEVVYRIPTGGFFRYVSGANFFGEITEWMGYAVATWSLPALSFALFSLCFIGPRALHHHRELEIFREREFKRDPECRKELNPVVF
uniref:3-oxo-5-alpha-steroid 4-dehydrogenase n=1 Tax=Tetraodon nigroviridis TaxID=99883 RepID=H3DGV9_TETNG